MRPIRTRFLYASPIRLSLLLNVSRWPIIQKVRRHPFRGSDCLYAHGFRIYFTPLPGFFSPFPHGTSSLSVNNEYLALEDGPPIFRQSFSCSALLVACLVPSNRFRIQGYHLYCQTFQTVLLTFWLSHAGFSHFARHYFGNLGWCLFLWVLRCFSSPGLLLYTYVFSIRYPYGWVSPFGNLRVKACCQLAEAYRRLPRPSSPIIAKASTMCTYSLDSITRATLLCCLTLTYSKVMLEITLIYVCACLLSIALLFLCLSLYLFLSLLLYFI